mmetsp:Transcript_14547/g.31166  ORF Transcript_14547/g.31166 Transcript_14547/m.31166 type:complete len:224 (+) Transcript_14547:462-1133(+)
MVTTRRCGATHTLRPSPSGRRWVCATWRTTSRGGGWRSCGATARGCGTTCGGGTTCSSLSSCGTRSTGWCPRTSPSSSAAPATPATAATTTTSSSTSKSRPGTSRSQRGAACSSWWRRATSKDSYGPLSTWCTPSTRSGSTAASPTATSRLRRTSAISARSSTTTWGCLGGPPTATTWNAPSAARWGGAIARRTRSGSTGRPRGGSPTTTPTSPSSACRPWSR